MKYVKPINKKNFFLSMFFAKENNEQIGKALKEWIRRILIGGQKEWKSCIRALTHWFEEITNNSNNAWTNGYIEGIHNKIKTIKKVSLGIPNFEHFRIKILLYYGGKKAKKGSLVFTRPPYG